MGIMRVPKKAEVVQIQQYRPICLLNVSFKIFTKVAVNRLTNVADKIIRPTQSAFMPRRHILEGVVVLNETLHELQQKKLNGVASGHSTKVDNFWSTPCMLLSWMK